MHPRVFTIVTLFIVMVCAMDARAQECPLGWAAGPLAPDLGGADGQVTSVIVYDPPGSQPMMLVAGGQFTHLGNIAAHHVAAWDGNHWYALDKGTDGPVNAFIVFNGNLIVAGNFTHAGELTTMSRDIAAWNGTSWLQIGNGIGHPDPQFYSAEAVVCLAIFNGELIAAGEFLSAGGVFTTRRARLAGSVWASMGESVFFNDEVIAMQVFDDDGAGPHPPALYAVVNDFDQQLMKWNGTSWINTGFFEGNPQAMAVTNQGLIVGGTYLNPSTSSMHIVGWNGSSVFGLGPGVGAHANPNDSVWALRNYNNELVVMGHFDNIGASPAAHAAAWNGSSWRTIGSGYLHQPGYTLVRSMTQFGSDLIAGGKFGFPEPFTSRPVSNLVKCNGTDFFQFRTPVTVRALATLGSRLVIGGTFGHTYDTANGLGEYDLVAWDGLNVTPISSGVNAPVHALKSFTALSTNYLVAGGDFTYAGDALNGVNANHIAQWSDAIFIGGWAAMGNGFNGPVLAIERTSSGTIFAGGQFTASGTGSPAFNRIAKWSGSPSSWSALDAGLNNTVRALKVSSSGFPDFLPIVLVGGDFTNADGVSANRIAYWKNGTTHATQGWATMSNGFNDSVYAIEVHNGSTYAAGAFTASGATTLQHVARWTGTAWVPVGLGFNGTVHQLKSHNGFLYATGEFSDAQGVLRVARWDGTTWTAVPGGLDGAADVILPFQTELIFGGSFEKSQSGAVVSPGLARHRIQGLPWIIRQPVSLVVPCHGTAFFDVDIPTGYQGLVNIRWHKNGVPLNYGWSGTGSAYSVFDGGADLQIRDVSDADEGAYQLVISNSCGTVTTTSVTLDVTGTCPPCPVDVAPQPVGDGVINVDDLLAVINSWGPCTPPCIPNCPTDVAPPGGNCIINVDDLLAVINAWGACP